MNRQSNVVQAGSGNGADILGGLLYTWQRKKNIDYRYSRDNELLTRQHELGMERDTHKSMESIKAAGASAVINSHFDNILEANKSANKMEQIGETGNEDRLTIKAAGKEDRRTIGHKIKKESGLKAQVHAQDTEMERLKAGNEIGRMSDESLYKQELEDKQSGNKIKMERLKAGNEIGRMSDEALYKEKNEDQQSDNKIKMERLKAGNEIGRMSDESLYKEKNEDQQSGNKIKLERERGKQTRASQKNTVQTGVKGMRDISSGLAENYEDPSTGISPLVSNPGGLQNIGNSLSGHPYLKANPKTTAAAPVAPKIGSNTGGDGSGSATVTPAKVNAQRVKKTGTYDDSYGGA